MKHKLDLEPNGDYNLEMRLNSLNSNDNLSNNNYINNHSNNNNNNNNNDDESSFASKIFKNLSRFKLSKTNKLNESEVYFNKSFESKIKIKPVAKKDTVDGETSNKKSKGKIVSELQDVNRWSIINESIKIFDNDSENEEIPLVFRDQKGDNCS